MKNHLLEKLHPNFCWTSYGRNRVLLIVRGVAYHKTEDTDLCWSATIETGVLFIGRGVAYHKTGLHGILSISTVDLLQPPQATVHPASSSSSLHLRLFIHGLLFIQPPPRAPPPATIQPALSMGSCSTTPPRATVHPTLHRLLFNQPSTGYCSTFPPWGPVHPAVHGILFIHAQPARRIGVLFIQWQHHGVLFIQPPPGTVHPNPTTTLTVHPEAASIGFS